MRANNESERICKEAVAALLRYYPLRKTTKIVGQDGGCPGRNSNLTPPEYKPEGLSRGPLNLESAYSRDMAGRNFSAAAPLHNYTAHPHNANPKHATSPLSIILIADFFYLIL
jgi:hypothetical protein